MLEELDTKIITETDTSTISLSMAASDAVKSILAERNLEGYALRVYVAGGGCCGVNFGMALDNNIRDVDTTFEANGVKASSNALFANERDQCNFGKGGGKLEPTS